jgi:hypothetical protein
VQFLIQESKKRQDEIEKKLDAICQPYVLKLACEYNLSLKPPTVQAYVRAACRRAQEAKDQALA